MIPLHDDNPTRIWPIISVAIIVLCVLAFFWQLSLGPRAQQAIYSFGMIPAVLFDHRQLPADWSVIPSWATLFSSMFMHGGWLHLIGNMLYLWIFGNNVEDAMGGASGAISGVLGAYLLLYPHARVLVAIPLGFIIHTTRLPAGIVLAFWFILQLINSFLSGSELGGVAWGAHIGGFVAGMVLIPIFKYKRIPLLAPRRSRFR